MNKLKNLLSKLKKSLSKLGSLKVFSGFKKLDKRTKRIIAGVLILVLVFGGGFGGLLLVRDLQKKPVNVYAVQNFSTMNEYGESSQTYGMVTTAEIQKVMISDTQTVKQVHVKEGDTVKKGDTLVTYDTTLSDIQLKKAKIAVDKLKLQKSQAEAELKALKNAKPNSKILITPPGVNYDVVYFPTYLQGDGTANKPKYFIWLDGVDINAYLEDWFFQGASEVYVVLLFRQNNAMNGRILNSSGMQLTKTEEGEVEVRMFNPSIPQSLQEYDEAADPYYQDSGSEYTKEELAKMRTEKEREIKELDISIRIAEVDLKRQEKEVTDGTVKSTVDGTVKVVRDADAAYQNSEPVVEVSAGGGYYIDVAMSELELGKVEVGQTVQVNSYMTGTFCEGTVVEISEYPTTNSNSWSAGNPEVSYYPFKVFVEESANLQENDYVDITYQSNGAQASGFYLEKQFIRTEKGRSYVYVRNEEGRLEQRTVQTGRELYGTYTEIRGGITMEDFVAFPYGKDVEDGAKTVESTVEEFYSDSGNGGGVVNV